MRRQVVSAAGPHERGHPPVAEGNLGLDEPGQRSLTVGGRVTAGHRPHVSGFQAVDHAGNPSGRRDAVGIGETDHFTTSPAPAGVPGGDASPADALRRIVGGPVVHQHELQFVPARFQPLECIERSLDIAGAVETWHHHRNVHGRRLPRRRSRL